MKPVKQTIEHDPENGRWGDCFRCCLASILEVEAEEVPHFYDKAKQDDDDADYIGRVDVWARKKGMRYFDLPVDSGRELQELLDTMRHFMPDFYLVLTGKSSLECGHSVVIYNGEIVNDPSGNGIEGPNGEFYWLGMLVADPLILSEVVDLVRGTDNE